MKRLIFPLLALALLAAQAARAESPAPAWPPKADGPGDPGALAAAAIEELIRALGLALQSLPQYDMPTMNERGDIIIHRNNPTPPRTAPPAEPDEERT
jgi:hypothetical protein